MTFTARNAKIPGYFSVAVALLFCNFPVVGQSLGLRVVVIDQTSTPVRAQIHKLAAGDKDYDDGVPVAETDERGIVILDPCKQGERFKAIGSAYWVKPSPKFCASELQFVLTSVKVAEILNKQAAHEFAAGEFGTATLIYVDLVAQYASDPEKAKEAQYNAYQAAGMYFGIENPTRIDRRSGVVVMSTTLYEQLDSFQVGNGTKQTGEPAMLDFHAARIMAQRDIYPIILNAYKVSAPEKLLLQVAPYSESVPVKK